MLTLSRLDHIHILNVCRIELTIWVCLKQRIRQESNNQGILEHDIHIGLNALIPKISNWFIRVFNFLSNPARTIAECSMECDATSRVINRNSCLVLKWILFQWRLLLRRQKAIPQTH